MKLIIILLFFSSSLLGQTIISSNDKLIVGFNKAVAFVKNNPNSEHSLKLLNLHFYSLPYADGINYFNKIDSTANKSAYEELTIKVKNAKLSQPGIIVKGFKFLSVDSTYASLDSIIRTHKLTLIDFWGSWCIPCRNNAAYLKTLYGKYSGNGLEIVGISLHEKSLQNLKEAIEKDGAEIWSHGLDNQKIIQTSLGVESVPAYILLNSAGVIIRRFSGRAPGLLDLENEIQKHLKSY
jgi:thiol-disulfide isomerase/thioredoxin